MAAIVGIDLGTTTTVAARFNEAGMPEVVTNWKGQAFIHSAFWFSKDNAYEPADIGDIARGLVGSRKVLSVSTSATWGRTSVIRPMGDITRPRS
jgi:molecular chaperone DnaK (HSP70)